MPSHTFCIVLYRYGPGLYRTNGRETDCKRNKRFLVGKDIDACIFIVVILLCLFAMDMHSSFFFLKESKEKIQSQTRTIHMKSIFKKCTFIY